MFGFSRLLSTASSSSRWSTDSTVILKSFVIQLYNYYNNHCDVMLRSLISGFKILCYPDGRRAKQRRPAHLRASPPQDKRRLHRRDNCLKANSLNLTDNSIPLCLLSHQTRRLRWCQSVNISSSWCPLGFYWTWLIVLDSHPSQHLAFVWPTSQSLFVVQYCNIDLSDLHSAEINHEKYCEDLLCREI